MSRAPLLKGIMLPALVQHTKSARSGYVKADGIALLLAFLRSCTNQVCRPSYTLCCQAAEYHAVLARVHTITSAPKFMCAGCFGSFTVAGSMVLESAVYTVVLAIMPLYLSIYWVPDYCLDPAETMGSSACVDSHLACHAQHKSCRLGPVN